MSAPWKQVLNRVNDYCWEIPTSYTEGMRVPGRIYASEAMLEHIWQEKVFQQVANVAFLPGIVPYSLAMPDVHWGYGFPIGGVAATRVSDGVVSPGGVGFDINCGVRLLRTNLTVEEVGPRIEKLITELYNNVPSGLGSKGKLRVSDKDLNEVMVKGSVWAAEHGYGDAADVEVTEDAGCIRGADPEKVSAKAKQRGIPQLGTLGSGNHFLEVERVSEIFDPDAARAMGINEIGQVLVLIHCGSRGFGHQVCTDYVALLGRVVQKYGINIPDRQLACAPIQSPEGKSYLEAMACAANYAWTNRQCILHWVRESLVSVFDKSRREMGLEQVYDVAHNIAKIEKHIVGDNGLDVCVHRKGATRAFPAGHPDTPEAYRKVGQPVLIPGDMGRGSYIALGTEEAMQVTFGSTCHGAGRMQSRSAAKRNQRGADVARALADKGITVKAGSMAGLAEEASEAYKDVDEVVDITHQAGISRRIVRAVPMGVVKG
ncbi:MAG: RtcB family protein [Dehalococcoidales bacterium]|nr:MAG: RtcB family protein [Dehalococcoidales bacterium]